MADIAVRQRRSAGGTEIGLQGYGVEARAACDHITGIETGMCRSIDVEVEAVAARGSLDMGVPAEGRDREMRKRGGRGGRIDRKIPCHAPALGHRHRVAESLEIGSIE